MNPTPDFLSQHPLSAAVVMLCTVVLVPFARELLKDRRERKADELSQSYLKSIADSNLRLADGQRELNVILNTSVEVNTERHRQNLEAMKHVCKCADCKNFKQNQ